MKQAAIAALWLAGILPGGAEAQTNGPPAPTRVTVTARAPAVVHKPDRTIYDLSHDPQAATSTVADILDTLPSVAVDASGAVNVRGTAAQVLIDGKPSASLRGDNLAAALQTLPAGTLARIEVITSPGPEFHSDAAVIINLVTRKAGAVPQADAVVTVGAQGRYNTTVSGSGTTGPWKLSGRLGLIQDIRDNIDRETRTSLYPDGRIASRMVSSGGIFIPYGAVAAGAGATYAFGDHDSLALDAQANLRRRPRTGHMRFITGDGTGATSGDVTTDDKARQVFNDTTLTATYAHKGRRDGETLTLQARHEEDDNLSDDRLHDIDARPVPGNAFYRHRRTNRELDDDLSGDYVLPLARDAVFKAGFELDADRGQRENFDSTFDPSSGAEIPSPPWGDRFLIDRVLVAAYVDGRHPLGRWVLEGGLRLERQQTRLRAARQAPPERISDVQLCPSLSLGRDLDDATNLHLTYDRHIRRPGADDLNPLPWTGPHDVFIGNPGLRAAHVDALEAGYAYTTKPLSVSATLYDRALYGDFVRYSYYRAPGDPVLVTSVENAGRTRTLGLDASIDAQPTRQWGYSLSSDLSLVSQGRAGAATRSLTTHVSRLVLRFDPETADSLQLRFAVNGRTLLIDGWQGGHSQISLSYSHAFSTRLKWVLNVNDIASGNRTLTHRADAQFTDDTSVIIPGRLVYAALDYRLGR
jgi:hypothetical protein